MENNMLVVKEKFGTMRRFGVENEVWEGQAYKKLKSRHDLIFCQACTIGSGGIVPDLIVVTHKEQ